MFDWAVKSAFAGILALTITSCIQKDHTNPNNTLYSASCTENHCQACFSDSDCKESTKESALICYNHHCVECKKDADCSEQRVCNADYECATEKTNGG